MKQTGKSSGIPFDEVWLRYLKDPKEADIALKLALKDFESDGDVNALLDTLRLIAQAQGGIAQLARKTAISRKAVHEALSPNGNPRLRTFRSVLEGLGIRMTLKPAHSRGSQGRLRTCGGGWRSEGRFIGRNADLRRSNAD